MGKRLFPRFIVSYLVVLSIPIAAGSLIYTHAANLLEGESRRAAIAVTEQTMRLVDAHLGAVQELAEQLMLNSQVRDFMYVPGPVSGEQLLRAVDIIRALSSLKTINWLVGDIYIYFPRTDVLLTTGALYSPQLFFRHAYGLGLDEGAFSFARWYELLRRPPVSGAFLADHSYARPGQMSQAEFLTYIHAIPAPGHPDTGATLVVLLDLAKLATLLDAAAGTGAVRLVDAHGTLIAASRDRSSDSRPAGRWTAELVVVPSSAVAEWRYVNQIDPRSYREKAEGVRRIVVWAALLCLALGSVAAYLLASRTYGPIRGLMEAVAGLFRGSPPECDGDEVDFIRRGVLSAAKENEELRLAVQNQLPIARNGILQELLRGAAVDMGLGDLRAFGLDFRDPDVLVIVFRMEEPRGGPVQARRDQIRLAAWLPEHGEHFASVFRRFYVTEVELGAVAVIGNGLVAEDYRRVTSEAAARLCEELESRHGIRMAVVAVGRPAQGLEGIHQSFEEAMRTADSRAVDGQGVVVFYSEASEAPEGFYHYPIESERRLLACLRGGDAEAAERLLASLFEENFGRRKLASGMGECLFYDLLGTLWKALDELSLGAEELFGEPLDPKALLESCRSYQEVRERISGLYLRVCENARRRRRGRRDELMERITAYIEANYATSFGQPQMAEHLGLSTSYLSHFFKDAFGENMVDYVARYRLSKAKQIIAAEPNLTMSEVSARVGLRDNIALTKLFKKYEGITPRAFRARLATASEPPRAQ